MRRNTPIGASALRATRYGNESYTYDTADRLSKIVYDTTGNQTLFSYDGFNRLIRIRETDAAGTVTSDRQRIWCGLSVCADRVNSTTINRRYYAHGEQRGTTKLYTTRDRLGSIRELTGNTGTLRAQYDYDPYGRSIKLQGDLNSDFRYTGHYTHATSGLTLAPFRAYEPTLGRWLNRDPIGEIGGVNLYVYVENNPINWVDPLGLVNIDPSNQIGGPFGFGGGGCPPNFIVSPRGTVFPVPKGAQGPTPVINPAGNQTGSAFTGGKGGANGQVDTLRMMDPTPPRGNSPGYPDGYIKYENSNGQGVDPYTGRTLPNSQSHYPK